MRRKLAILLTMALLITVLAVPGYAVAIGDFSVDLYYWNSDKTVKTAFDGTWAYLDEMLDPFQGQIKVVLSETVDAGTYFDLDLAFTASEGEYSISSIEVATSGDLVFSEFVYSYAEMDSTHISIQGLGVDKNLKFPVGIVYIDFTVSNPVYDVTTTVVNGSSVKQYGFLLSLSDVTVSSVDEVGFFARILQGILNLPNALVEGIKNLFLPTQAEAIDFRDKMDALLRDRLGPAYEANDIIEDFAYSLGAGTETLDEDPEPATITMPALTVDLAGADFTFGGWEVRVIPEGFEEIVKVLKTVVNMVCTLAFLNALRDRWESVFH